mgnify:CR=1 FL=1
MLLPSDHYLPNVDSFLNIIEKGLTNIPETAYGYIKKGNYLENDCYEVLKFKEKPIKYLNNGNVLMKNLY